MKRFAVATTIHANADTIWSILTDARSYPNWNSTVETVSGIIAAGQKVTVRAKAAPGRAFPVTVTEFAPPQRMVWIGGMPFGLFTGTRTFTITPNPDGTAEFMMQEEFGGLLDFLISRSIPDLQPMFERFASDLKRRAEQGQ